jgi:hypothetical protein
VILINVSVGVSAARFNSLIARNNRAWPVGFPEDAASAATLTSCTKLDSDIAVMVLELEQIGEDV